MVERQLEQNEARIYTYQIIFGTQNVPSSDTRLNMIIHCKVLTVPSERHFHYRVKRNIALIVKNNAETRIGN